MIISVRVKPNSKKGPIVQPALDGSLLVYVKEPAQEGKANVAVTKLLADHFGVAYSSVKMISGRTAHIKRFNIQNT